MIAKTERKRREDDPDLAKIVSTVLKDDPDLAKKAEADAKRRAQQNQRQPHPGGKRMGHGKYGGKKHTI